MTRTVSMTDETRLLGLIDELYGAVLDDEALPSTFKSLADFASARSAFYLTADARSGAILSADSVNIDPTVQQEYVEHWSDRDVLVPPALPVPVGELMTEYDLVPRGEFQKSEIFHDLYRRRDIPHLLVTWVSKTPTALTAFSLQRSAKQGRFDDKHKQRYQAVVPHLVRALQIRKALSAARHQVASFMRVVDRLPFGVAFLDDAGRVTEASAAIEGLLRAETAISFRHGTIHAVIPDDDKCLQKSIRQALRPKADRLIPGDTLLVKRRDSKRPLSISVLPVRSPVYFLAGPPSCMLVVFDPEGSERTETEAVRRILHLTEAEARLACALFTGITLREAANQLQLSINTCKSQLKSIYAKTGCKSHVELAKAVLMTSVGLQ